MTDDLTPWEDINPPMVSARRPELPSPSSDAREVFRNELTACLTLTAPVGMTEEAKRDWFAVAWDTLKDIPPDILAIGAKAARQKCDHPAKIVPAILAETKEMRSWRQSRETPQGPNYPKIPAKCCTAEQAAEILEQYGLRRKPSGSH